MSIHEIVSRAVAFSFKKIKFWGVSITKFLKQQIYFKVKTMIQTDVDSRGGTTVAVTTGLLVLDILMVVTGNSLVCLALCRNRRLRTITNLYVLSLAIGDIGIAILPFSVIASVRRKWPFGYNFCQFDGYATHLWGSVSIYTMALTAINRYFCVVKPQHYPYFFTK